MNTWETPLQKQAFQPRPDWFEVLLPIPTLPLMILLVLILPIFLLTAESLFAPLYDYIHSLLLPVNVGMSYTHLPLQLLIKIGLFSVFTFTGVMLLLLKISCLYHEVWSYFVPAPHSSHPAYHPDQQESMIALFNWSVFHALKTVGLPLGWVMLTLLVGSVGFWFFSSFTDFGFFSFQLQVVLGFFAMSVLCFFTGLAAIKGIWAACTTMLGDVAAITEPEKPTQVLYERSRRLAFLSPWSIFLYPLYAVFYGAVLAEIVLLLARFDIVDILHLNSEVVMVFGFAFVTLLVYLLLSAMKFMTYHDALTRFYRNR